MKMQVGKKNAYDFVASLRIEFFGFGRVIFIAVLSAAVIIAYWVLFPQKAIALIWSVILLIPVALAARDDLKYDKRNIFQYHAMIMTSILLVLVSAGILVDFCDAVVSRSVICWLIAATIYCLLIVVTLFRTKKQITSGYFEDKHKETSSSGIGIGLVAAGTGTIISWIVGDAMSGYICAIIISPLVSAIVIFLMRHYYVVKFDLDEAVQIKDD